MSRYAVHFFFITDDYNILDMPEQDIVLSAEELRQAANALGRITGRIDVENVLDVLFGQFCIGK